MIPADDLHFAKLAVQQGLCEQQRVDECVSFLARLAEQGVTPLPRLAELLVRKGYLTPTDATLRPSSHGAGPDTDPQLPPEAAACAQDPDCQLGKYIKVSRLGAGGMGEVWKGWDRELGRWVALKFLRQSDPTQEARLRREAQTAAALSHPHIASVHEVGVKNGAPFIAMQYIEGQTLATVSRKDPRAIVGLIRDAALAVHHAHGQGVIHRDLKPANLMVQDGCVYVMDFGLAKATSVDSSLSVSGSIVGTPAYMSPEQARGRTGEISGETDVYSLGATLYELLSDQPPFRADEVYALLRKVIEEDPVPLRRRKASIDRDLETIVLKCLEKQPSRRYRTARELAEDLDNWLRGEPIHAHPPSTLYRIKKFVGRRKSMVAIGAAGLVVSGAALGILIPSWLHERALKELAPLRTQIAVVREWVRQPFRKPEEIQRALQAEVDGVSAYIERHRDLPQGPFVRAQAWLHLGDLPRAEKDARDALRLDAGFLPAWTLLGRVQLEIYAGLLTAESIDPFKVRQDLAKAALAEARESLRRGRTAQDARAEIEAWGLTRTRDDAVGATLADALYLYYVQGSRDEALKRLDEAHRRSPSEEYRLWAARWTPFGKEKDLRIQETIDIAPLYAPGHVERGSALAYEGKLTDALRAYADAVARDPRSAAAYIGRGLVRGELEDYRGAIDDFTKALALDRRDTSAYLYRGAVRNMSGDPDGAIADCDKALEIHPDSVGALINRSIAKRTRKDYAGALADLSRIHAINPKLPHAWTNQAGTRQEMDDLKGAIEDVSRAIEIDGTFREAWRVRALLLEKTNDLDGSIRDLTRAIELPSQEGRKGYRAGLFGQRCMCRLLRGDLEGGLADAREADRLEPDGSMPSFWLGNALLARGDAEGAIRSYGRSIERAPAYSDAWNGRAQALLTLGRLPEAIIDASRALELDSANVAALLVRAAARQRQKDFRGAEEDCTRAIAVQETGQAFLMRSSCRGMRGRFPEAAADADKAQGLFPAGSPQRELARKWGDAFRAGKMP